MKRIAALIFLGLALYACKSKKKLAEQAVEEKRAPEWVNNRPVSSSYYTGIGVASKEMDPVEYSQVAKRNALNDLASEIEVTVDANSVLYSLEQKGQYSEDFMSTTKLRSSLDLEAYEQVDTWQTEDKYYAYYRLSKAEYAAAKARKRDEAASKAAAYIKQARDAKAQQSYRQALNNYLEGFLSIQEFLGDALQVQVGEGTAYAGSMIVNEVNELLNGIQFSLPEGAILFNLLRREEQAGVYVNDSEGNGISSLVFKVKNTNAYTAQQITTNTQGFLVLKPSELEISSSKGQLRFELLVDEMLTPSLKNDKLVKLLLDKVPHFQKEIPYRINYPRIFIQGDEKNLGESAGTQYLKQGLTQAASEMGFPIANAKGSAEVLIEITGNTSEGSINYGMYTSLLNGVVEFRSAGSNELIYTFPVSNQKGVGLNYQAAGKSAYEKGAEKLKSEVFQDFLKTMGF